MFIAKICLYSTPFINQHDPFVFAVRFHHKSKREYELLFLLLILIYRQLNPLRLSNNRSPSV